MYGTKLSNNSGQNNVKTISNFDPNNLKQNDTQRIGETLHKIDDYVLLSPIHDIKKEKATEAIKYMLTGQTSDKELMENNVVTPLQTSELFSTPLELKQLEFFQLVYLANFIEPVTIFSANGQLNTSSVKQLIDKLIENKVPECQIKQYEQDIQINEFHKITFTPKSSSGIANSYTHTINNYIVNIKPHKLRNHEDKMSIINYTRVPGHNNTLGYWSKKGNKNIRLNGRAIDSRGHGIECRHLAFEQLKISQEDYANSSPAAKIASKSVAGKRYHGIFSSTSEIAARPGLKDYEFDKFGIHLQADNYYAFSLNNFGKCLANICRTMNSGDTKYILLLSENHVMSVIIRDKSEGEEKKYMIKFYDPNKTAVHRNLLTSSIEAIEDLLLGNNQASDSAFLSPEDTELYFPKLKTGVFLIYNDPNKDRSGEEITNNNNIDINFVEQKDNMLHQLFYLNDLNNVIVLANQILAPINSLAEDVATDEKEEQKAVELLKSATVSCGIKFPGLYLAFIGNHTEIVEQFAQIVVNSKLSEKAKMEILSAKSGEAIPGLHKAFAYYGGKIVIQFTQTIIGSNLSEDNKFKLLRANDYWGNAGFYHAFANNQEETVMQFTQAILNSNLSEDNKFKLLEAKAGGIDGFYHAFANNQEEIVIQFTQAILGSNLEDEHKLKLLRAKKTNGGTGLGIAFISNYSKIIAKCIQLILESELTDLQKRDFLMDVPNYMMALMANRSKIGDIKDSLEAFRSAIANSTLQDRYKSEIFDDD